jgi:hypothetical protein
MYAAASRVRSPTQSTRQKPPKKVPTTGLEPVRRFRHWSLKPACLPISARGRAQERVLLDRPTAGRSARGGTRTLTGLPPQDPESCASTNSATRASRSRIQILPPVDIHGEASLPHGAEGARTPDLCNAIAALSQLSYSPIPTQNPNCQTTFPAGLTGLEPAASGVTDRHSNQLSYSPRLILRASSHPAPFHTPPRGIEPRPPP